MHRLTWKCAGIFYYVNFTAALLTSCQSSHRAIQEGEASLSAENATMIRNEEFFAGLLAPPGSPERIAAGNALKRAFEAHLPLGSVAPRSNHDSADEFTLKEETALTKRMVKNTIDYLLTPPQKLIGGSACAPEEKIRLYRGVSAHPFIGPANVGDNGVRLSKTKGFFLAGSWQQQIVANLKKKKESNAINWEKPNVQKVGGELQLVSDDMGTTIYKHLTDLDNKARLKYLNWKDMFTPGKKIVDPSLIDNFGEVSSGSGGDEEEENSGEGDPFAFMQISRLHTELDTYSAISPLLSTTLEPSIADEYAPALAVLDVCPERALLVTNTDYFFELEAYVPLFILPEEVSRIKGFECGIGRRESHLPRSDCWSGHAEPQEAKQNAVSQAFKSCYLLTGSNFETRISDVMAGEIFKDGSFRDGMNRYESIKNRFYKNLYDSDSNEKYRTGVKNILANDCKVDCSIAKKIIAYANEMKARPIPASTDDPFAMGDKFWMDFRLLAEDYLTKYDQVCTN